MSPGEAAYARHRARLGTRAGRLVSWQEMDTATRQSWEDIAAEDGGVPSAMPRRGKLPSLGRLAYEAYCNESRSLSLHGSDNMPPWNRLNGGFVSAWNRAAAAVCAEVERQRAAKEN